MTPAPIRLLAIRLVSVLVVGNLIAVAPLFSAEPLPRASPESLGIDPDGLEQALIAIGQVSGRKSAVVVRDGQVAADRYWVGTSATLYDVRSVTKSVSSMLVGIAIERGFIESIDSRMVDYLPWHLRPTDLAKRQITLRHLLTMSSGLQWSENQEIVSWVSHPDPVRFILGRPVVNPPGSDFNYSTPASHLLSVVLSQATGTSPRIFARNYLFAPLGIDDFRWETDPQGYVWGGMALQLRTEDMAKLGLLFLRGGRWDDAQLLSIDWIANSIGTQMELGASWGALHDIHYGCLWWSDESLEHRVFFALGWGGQFVFCVPALELVVATTAEWFVPLEQADAQERAILDAIVNRLLPAVSMRDPDPRRPVRRIRSRGAQRPAIRFPG